MFLERYSLDSKVALIVGASRGIGKALAIGFAEAGADMVIASRKLPDLELAASEISGLGRHCLAIPTNATKKEDINSLVSKAVAEFGKVDILVNSAATSPYFGETIDMEEWAWDYIMNLNLRGTFMLSQAVAKIMKTHGDGCIINVASTSGFRPFPNTGAYCVSKAAVIMLTRVLALELGKHNIRVNAIAPGVTKTQFSQGLLDDPELLDTVVQHTALRRIANPEDMVGIAILLASDASRQITGQIVCVDGGLMTF